MENSVEVSGFLKKSKIELSYAPVDPLLDVFPEEIKL